MKGPNGETTLAGCWRETCLGTRPRGNVSRVRRGPYCAVPVLVRPRPARSRLVRWPALSVCHFSASGYRRRRGALLDPVCLFERLMRLTDAGGAFALHRTTEHWSQRAICFFCWPNGQFSACPPPPERRVLYGGTTGTDRAGRTQRRQLHHAFHPRFRSARLIPCRAVNPNPLEADIIVSTSPRLGWIHEASI